MRKTLLSLCIAMASLSVFAAPARKGSTVIKLVNGTELKASLQGDEFLHYYLAEDDKCYKQNADGLYELMDVTAARENARMKRAQINKNMGVKRQRMMKAGEKKDYFGQKKGLIMLVQFPDRSFQSAHDKNFYENFANKENYTDGSFKGSVRDYYHAQSGGRLNLRSTLSVRSQLRRSRHITARTILAAAQTSTLASSLHGRSSSARAR